MELPEYVSIVLNDTDLLPLDDLQAQGGYERKLLMPDDMPVALTLPYAISPEHPKLNTCQPDGSLNVFMTGQTGGGSGAFPDLTAPLFNDSTNQFAFPSNTLYPVSGAGITARYLYGYSLSIVGAQGSANTTATLTGLVRGHTNHVVAAQLFAAPLSTAPGVTLIVPVAQTVAFPWKMDVLAMTGDTAWEILLSSPGVAGSYGIGLHVYAGTA